MKGFKNHKNSFCISNILKSIYSFIKDLFQIILKIIYQFLLINEKFKYYHIKVP